MLKRILPFIALLFALPLANFAQVTTSSMNGAVKTATGEELVGASIIATHVPTGTIYRTQTRKGGIFDISNMNPGGPYTVVASFVNYSSATRSDIYLSLGESFKVDLALAQGTGNLGTVTVLGTRSSLTGSSRGGTETMIGRDKMENLPTVGRNINDYLRAVPQAKLTQANNEGITIAGQNNRYNSFYVDGALNNDVFGLAASGTNGGQTSTSPISIDAIDQFQVVISPYDASLGNFTGGGINAITRSGTNKTQASVYYFYRNEDLAGKTPTGYKGDAQKLAEFQNKTYGARIGGALVQNKLFYFVNAEMQRDVRPQPFNTTQSYQGNTKSVADIKRLYDTLRARGGYNPGTYLDNPEEVEADRIAAKVDWNINDKNKLSISHRYTRAERYNRNVSSTTAINFGDNGWIQPNKTNSTSLELKSNIGRNGSNRLLLTYTKVADDRNPIGAAYPRIIISDGTGTGTTQGIIIGPDPSANINILTQKNFSLLDIYRYNLGRHSLSAGVEVEYSDVKNAFVQRVFGEYQYDSIQQFYNNARPRQYRVAYSLIDNVKGDATEAAAAFKILKSSAFINDEFKVNNNLTINMGIRADYYKWLTTPATSAFANDTALPAFAKLYDLQGARSGMKPSIPVSISPRLGFTLKIPEENVVIRGGFGYFTSRIPLVWPGGVYNNNGLYIGGFTASSSSNTAAWNTIRFNSDPFNQPTATSLGISEARAKGGLNLISEKFRNPRVFRSSFGLDKKFGDGWSASFEGIYTKNVNEAYYTNLNAQAPLGLSKGPGARLVYDPAKVGIYATGTPNNPYDNAILLTNNNKTDKGFAYNLSAVINKNFRNNFSLSVSYAYGQSYVVNEATSSVNVSQWQFMETVNGRNNITRSQSDFSLGHRIFAYASKKFTYAKKNLATTISLVYTGQSGAPFSYVYSGAVTRDDASAGGSGGNDLIYIPTSADINTYLANGQILSNTTGGVTYTAAQQAAAMETYISNNKYLKTRRGEFAERNGSRLPFTNILDLKLAQDFNLRLGKNRYQLQLTYDVFNFSNMINRNWGRSYFLSNDQFAAITFAGYKSATDLTPTYRFTPANNTRKPWGVSTSAVPASSARWISQVGVRLNFN